MSWFTRFLGLDNAVESTVKKTLQESFPFLPGTPANGTLDYPLCRPDADGFLPVGFYRNRSKQGDNPQAYLHDEDLRRAREQSRDLACSNEYARNGLVNRRNYIVGTGFKVTAESVSDDTANDALVQQVNDWLARYAAITKRCEKEKESVMRGDRDGECFLRLFKEDGLLQWRFVEPEHVGNFDGQTPFGIKTDPDITKVIHYLVRYEDGGPVEEVPAEEMIHVKLNTDSGIKRGLPFLYPVFGILRKIESTNMNMATNVAIMASIAMIRRRQFELQTTVDTSNSTAADVQTSNPFNRGASVDNYRVFRPGTILDVDGQTEYEFPANQINLSGVVEVKQSLLQTAAAGMGLPEYMLTSDASNGNFASTQVAETPAIAGFLAMQHLWADVFGCGPYVEGADNGLTWKAIELAVEEKMLPENVLTDIRLNTEGPSIEVRDKAAETQRNQSLADAGIISRDKWAKKEGEHKAHKSDEEMQAAKDKEQQASQQHELAMAGAKSSKLKEEWEEDLHPRADDGKFADKGGEGENGQKKETAKKKLKKTSGAEVSMSGSKGKGHEAALAARLKDWLPDWDDSETTVGEAIASITGMPDDATKYETNVDFTNNGTDLATDGKFLRVSVTRKGLTMERLIGKDDKGVFVINKHFEMKTKGKGTGAELFSKQVEAAASIGVYEIRCHAACTDDDGERYFNGYYTWPRLGYDQPLEGNGVHESDKKVYDTAKERFPGAKTVLDVMQTEEGRQWWKDNGTDMLAARFDLSEGSRSLKIHQAYMEVKKSKK